MAIWKKKTRRNKWSDQRKKELFSDKAHGGVLRTTRQGRGKRFLTETHSMHMVLRSSRAQGPWSFKRKDNERKIRRIVAKFTHKYKIEVESLAVVGNHVHFHLWLSNRKLYKAFIRAITSAIAMAITGVSRWNKKALEPSKYDEVQRKSFWDHRPYTKIIYSFRQFLKLSDYLEINKIEGLGYSKQAATKIFKNKREWAKEQIKLLEQMNV